MCIKKTEFLFFIEMKKFYTYFRNKNIYKNKNLEFNFLYCKLIAINFFHIFCFCYLYIYYSKFLCHWFSFYKRIATKLQKYYVCIWHQLEEVCSLNFKSCWARVSEKENDFNVSSNFYLIWKHKRIKFNWKTHTHKLNENFLLFNKIFFWSNFN